jgi:DNA-binding transcriptional MerR regulator
MNPSPDTPVYNLKAVVRETGLKPDTIRAWERRYGLPEPRRTDSGHRLYSQNDITMLKWLVARQNEGMSISRAVVLWQRLQEMQTDPTDAAAIAFSTNLSMAEAGHASKNDMVAQMREAWVQACVNFDEQSAERAISQAFALFSVEVVCVELIQRGLAMIGEGWFQGRVTVQQEHFASALATRRIEALLASTPAPTRTSRILIGCPPQETHTFAPMLLTLLLRRRGWDVLFLGADIPLDNLIVTTRSVHPQLIILVAQQLYTAANLLEMSQLLVNERVPIAFGGRIFTQVPEVRQRIPGHYLGDHIDQAAQVVESVMALPRIQTALTPTPYDYQEALHHFKARAAQIDAEVWRRVGSSGVLHDDLVRANSEFSRNIMAALVLGNLDFLRPTLDAVEEIFENRYEMAEQMVDTYIEAYLNALELHTNGRGAVITRWLRNELYQSYPGLEEEAVPIPSRAAAINRG